MKRTIQELKDAANYERRRAWAIKEVLRDWTELEEVRIELLIAEKLIELERRADA